MLQESSILYLKQEAEPKHLSEKVAASVNCKQGQNPKQCGAYSELASRCPIDLKPRYPIRYADS